MKKFIRRLIDAVVMRSSPCEIEYVLLVKHDKRRPKVKAYQMGEGWYAHEIDVIPEWRTKLLPKGKVDGFYDVIAWEPVTPNMVEFYRSA